MLSQRQGIVVWLHSLKQAKLLRRYGNVIYISKKLKYVLFYCNSEDTEMLVDKLNRQSYVKKVEVSHKPTIKTHYENSRPDKAKEYDYKMGL